MIRNQNPVFDYTKEPSRDILCIDCKSFYASVECAERHLDPLTTKLVVMSYPSGKTDERGSGLILAASPAAKKAYHITNISRARDLPFPYPDDLYMVPPRMAYYMKKIPRSMLFIKSTWMKRITMSILSMKAFLMSPTV